MSNKLNYYLESSVTQNYIPLMPEDEITNEDRNIIDQMILDNCSDNDIITKISSLTLSNSYNIANTYSYYEGDNQWSVKKYYETIYTQCTNTIAKYSNVDMIRQYISFKRNISQIITDIIYNYGTEVSDKYIKEILHNSVSSKPLQKPDDNSMDYEESTQVVKLNKSRRKVVRINDLYAYTTTFGDKGSMTLIRNVCSEFSSVKSISIFCNEHNCSSITSEKYVKYFLIINDVEYEVEPINSERNGVKIIKNADHHNNEYYVKYIKEKILSISMRIEFITASSGQSPYISDLKLCIRKGD